ncbi:MAG: creatininase family protein [Aestuariivita sp.]|nr:creatininase family protein [Aestuariivita sp.]MCY4203673.1 creatininase family protein [Aestuariivita sp.]MCY4287005.1 creatininase family protein [Aestuariivita sp.]MCY4347652.1 creatininase family protein [Aestuariivita sp.]
MRRRLDWAEYRHNEYRTVDQESTIAIFPTAAVEQHGPHLPVGTDMYIAQGMLDKLRQLCPNDLDIRILPVQAIGKSNEHQHAIGTITLSAQTALKVWTEIGLSVAGTGLRKIVIINSHGGNLALIDILARELRVQAAMLAIKCQWGGFGYPEGLFSEQEQRFGIHGGDVETSLMLAFQPHCVDMEQAKDFRSTAESEPIQPIGPISYGWIASDLNSEGVVGEAHLATAEKGRETCALQVNNFIEFLRTVRDTKLQW